jgi:ASC-1-like (ASCH) protein
MTKHSVKIIPAYFDAVKNGLKTFEIRKLDRDYKIGDTLILSEWQPETLSVGSYTGRRAYATILYILTHDLFPDGIKDGYGILGIRVEKVME